MFYSWDSEKTNQLKLKTKQEQIDFVLSVCVRKEPLAVLEGELVSKGNSALLGKVGNW